MKLMELGDTGIMLPKMAFGTFALGGGTSWSDTTGDEKELGETVLAAIECGMTAIDTAPVYGTSSVEIMLGKLLKAYGRDKVVLATKCSLNWREAKGIKEYDRDGKSVYRCFEPASIRQDVEDSLARLQTDYLDICIVHRAPAVAEVPALMETLLALKKAGAIRAIGLSNAPPEILQACLAHGRVDLVQESFSFLSNVSRQAYFELCEREGVVFQAFGLLSHGALAKRAPEQYDFAPSDFRLKYKLFQAASRGPLNGLFDAVSSLVEKYGCSAASLFIAWAEAQLPLMNLLIGARRKKNVIESARAVEISLEADDLACLNQLRLRVGKELYGNKLAFTPGRSR